MATRIYIVEPRDGSAARLVRAIHPTRAIGHVAGLVYDVRVADQEDIVRAMTAGATVETAGEPAPADKLELPLAADAQ